MNSVKIIHDGLTYKLKISELTEFQKYLESSLIFNKNLYDPLDPPPIPFDELHDKLNEKFPSTALSRTNYTYSCYIKTLYKSLGEKSFSLGVLSDFSRIEDAIENVTDKINTKISLYMAISKMYHYYGVEVPTIYWNTIGRLKKEKNSNQYGISDVERKNILRLDDEMGNIEERLVNNLNEGKGTPYQYQKLWLFHAYTSMPPIRRDYCTMVFDVDEKGVNSIDTENFIIHMKSYKNCKTRSGGDYQIDLNEYPIVLNAFKDFLDHHPNRDKGSHVVISTKHKKVRPSNFTKLLSGIFFKSCGVDLLRKYYLNKRINCEDVKIQEEIARVMRHTIKTRNSEYIKEGLALSK